MFTKGLPQNLQNNLALLGKLRQLKQFYLAGGSALSLLLGHRISVDLYFIVKKIPLGKIFKLFSKKYKRVHYSLQHLLKSLTYFEDAEKDVMPPMLTQVSWDDVKEFFEQEVKKLTFQI